jgi:NitT/TauT family transport system ATP-binding protein
MMTQGLPITVQGLRKYFRQTSGGQQVLAIDRLDFTIEPGELVAIVGQTGCGKSTFFDVMIGLEQPSEGRIDVGGQTPYGDFDAFRGRIATIFQQDRLMPWRSCLDNVRLPLELLGVPHAEQVARSTQWLERLGLGRFLTAYPHELSGGMRQRAAIARAFVLQPSILLADEAFGHLDEVTAADLRSTFVALARECRATAILITHQLEEAISVGDRILVFGRPSRLLADVRVGEWPEARYATLREAIQTTLQRNETDPRLLIAQSSPDGIAM